MKTSTKWISIISISLSALLLITTSLGVFVAANSKNINVSQNNQNENQSTNQYQFFNENKNELGNQYNLSRYIQRIDVLYHLTDFMKHFDQNLIKFDEFNIEKNLLFLIRKSLKNIKKFAEIDKYYINVKYKLEMNNTLLIDIRWGDKMAIINHDKTTLFWDQIKITIS